MHTNSFRRYPALVLCLTTIVLGTACAAEEGGSDDSNLEETKSPCVRSVNWDGFTNGEGKLTASTATALARIRDPRNLVDGTLVQSINTSASTVVLKRGVSGVYTTRSTTNGIVLDVRQKSGDANSVKVEFKIQDFGGQGRYLAARISSNLDSWAVDDCKIAGEVFHVVTAVAANANK